MTPPRPRRTDPGRRDRLIDVALDVIAERGVAGTTHRSVAAAADVPLGSMTYHFTSRDELLYLAFERMAHAMHDRFDAALAAVPAGADPREGVVTIICDEKLGYARDMLLTTELYALAMRKSEFRTLTQSWMDASRASLARYFPAHVVPMIDALIEGLILHGHLGTEPFDVDRVREAVHRVAAGPSGMA